ncbi:hypothetical protein HYU22_02685 [Candidatus Woesearchaeota archaeon]|nr:hypothetical protein [Candidatus Woesearchaeota archaeon]
MKKVNNYNKTYNSISRQEATLLNAVEMHLVFSLTAIRRLTGWKTMTISNVLTSLKKKGVIVAVKKNAYVLASKIPEHSLSIATIITHPSYISFWTAGSYYGFTEQQAQVIQVVSTKQHRPLKIGLHHIEIMTVKPAKWFGYTNINNIPIAEPEKLLVECLYKPEKIGGIDEMKKILKNAWPKINQATLRLYIERYHVKAIFARLGFLLEDLNLRNDLEQQLMRRLPKGYTRLNPAKKAVAAYDQKWRLIMNDQ